MARQLGRRLDESAAPERLLPGEHGPWATTDKAEFHHAGKEAQEWFLRLDKEEVELQEYSQKIAFWVRTAIVWAKRLFWAFTTGLGAALVAGENLQKLPAMISGFFSKIRGLS